ncbi:MAG: hypothetical protein KH268_10870 [Clostridiales bacterium]|nr:hypothetical protein [Clostridiales bacterium]
MAALRRWQEQRDDGGDAHIAPGADALSSDISNYMNQAGRNRCRGSPAAAA